MSEGRQQAPFCAPYFGGPLGHKKSTNSCRKGVSGPVAPLAPTSLLGLMAVTAPIPIEVRKMALKKCVCLLVNWGNGADTLKCRPKCGFQSAPIVFSA
jgi:hypothetical protein